MKKILLLGLLSLALVALSTDAMKRELSSDEPAEKEAKFNKKSVQELLKAYEESGDVAFIDEVASRMDKKDDEEYPNEFYYVPGVPRKLVFKYCGKMSSECKKFERAWSYCYGNDYPGCSVKSFLSRYLKAVISRAVPLRDSNLQQNEVGNELAHAIQAIEADKAELSYLVTGSRNWPPFTHAEWQKHWKNVEKASFELPGYSVAQ